jgi:hypothetical protein
LNGAWKTRREKALHFHAAALFPCALSMRRLLGAGYKRRLQAPFTSAVYKRWL